MHPRLSAAACAVGTALAVSALPAAAMNRCITPAGRITYTDKPCHELGAKPHGEMKGSINVVPSPAPKAAPPSATPSPGADPDRRTVFRKSPKAPTLTVCYDPKEARAEARQNEVEPAIQRSVSLWNAGCNINYEYVGQCPPDDGTWSRNRADYKVYWASWDDTLTTKEYPDSPVRDHAVAIASSTIGVALNRDVSVPAWRLERAIVHELGHVIGIGHSKDPGDLMFSGGKQRTPTEADFQACNRSIEERHGIKADYR